MSDPVQTLKQIIEEWYDVEVETQNHSWKLTPVNEARSWSPNKDLLNPVYVLTRNGDPFHLTRPHGVFEVLWGEKSWTCACPPKVAELLSLCWSPSKCMWANACAKLCHVVRWLPLEGGACGVPHWFFRPSAHRNFLLWLDTPWPASCLAAIRGHPSLTGQEAARWSSDDEGLRSAWSHVLLGYLLHMYYAIWELAIHIDWIRQESLPWQEPGDNDLS